MTKRLPLSLDTIRLNWGVQPIEESPIEDATSVELDKISTATKNQLKKRRPTKGRR